MRHDEYIFANKHNMLTRKVSTIAIKGVCEDLLTSCFMGTDKRLTPRGHTYRVFYSPPI